MAEKQDKRKPGGAVKASAKTKASKAPAKTRAGAAPARKAQAKQAAQTVGQPPKKAPKKAAAPVGASSKRAVTPTPPTASVHGPKDTGPAYVRAEAHKRPRYALVLSGGGARGAYEAGVIHYLRTKLPREISHAPIFQIYSGTSVGAITSAFMASTAHDPIHQGRALRRIWENLTSEDIYYADAQALASFLVKTGFFTSTNFFGLSGVMEKRYGRIQSFPFKSVLDTTPFVNFIRRNIGWSHIHSNIQSGAVEAVTASATHMLSGVAEVFVEKAEHVHFRRGGMRANFTTLSPKHILASAALPVFFPMIRINKEFYGDGSLRQNTPMSPAIQLGAERLFLISLRKPPQKRPEDGQVIHLEPTLGDLMGQVLNSIFLDKMDYDLNQLRRINYLLNDMETIFGPDAIDKLNALRRETSVAGKVIHTARTISPFVIQPSQNMGRIAAEALQTIISRRHRVSPLHRFFHRVVEGAPDGENDLVSYFLFEKEYLLPLLELGYQDAQREHDHLVRFFSGQPLTEGYDAWH